MVTFIPSVTSMDEDTRFNAFQRHNLEKNILSSLDSSGGGAYAFKRRYLADQLYSKYCDERAVDRNSVRFAAALLSLEESETKNASVFDTIADVNPTILAITRAFVAKVLGPLDFEKIFKLCRFSNGGTTQSRRSLSDVQLKYCWDTIEMTHKARPYFQQATAHMRWRPEIKVVCGNRIDMVLKNAKTYRTICIEPAGNSFLQLSVGEYIKQRFLGQRTGYMKTCVDLKDQTINQRLALRASALGDLATVDFKNASNSINEALVYHLLPNDWYYFLNDIRSEYGIMPDGTVRRWNLFGSMGNGFTFELESLLFWALTRATLQYRYGIARASSVIVSIFGDDLITTVDIIDELRDVFAKCGLQFNDEKSYWKGKFRESCGKHYYNGFDVTPFYIKAPPESIYDCIRILNRIREWSYDDLFDCCSPDLERVWRQLQKAIPNYRKVTGYCELERTDIIAGPKHGLYRYVPDTYTYPFGGYGVLWYSLHKLERLGQSVRSVLTKFDEDHNDGSGTLTKATTATLSRCGKLSAWVPLFPMEFLETE